MKRLILTFLLLCAVPPLSHAQAIYLALYEGNGTDANPYRATGLLPGHTCKSIRASEQQQSGYGLCKGPMVPARAGVIDLSGKRAITKVNRDQMLADNSITITATTFDGLISELVDSQNVKLGRKDGRQRIVIGNEEVWSRPAPLSSYIPDLLLAPVKGADWLLSTPVAWAAATLSESFTCADDSDGTYSCDLAWTRATGTVAAIVSNAMQTVNSVLTQRLRTTPDALDGTDMYGRVTVSTIDRGTATNIDGGIAIRHASDGTVTYLFCVLRDAATDEVEFGHVSAGSLTVDGTVSATVANGDTVQAEANGDQFLCKHNGATVLGPITESTGDGNLAIGLRFAGTGTATTTTVILDNVEAGPISTSFGPLRRRGL